MFVIDTLASGGKERRMTELLKVLSLEEDVKVELVTMSNVIHYNDIFDLDIKITQLLRKRKKELSMFGKLYSLIKVSAPDAVHCWESMTAVYLAPVCRILRCPLINGMVTNVPLQRNIFYHHWLRARLTFPFSRVIVSNSKAGLTAYKVPVKRGRVIYNGYNFERLLSLTAERELKKELDITTTYVVGMVASFGNPKDYPCYYKAAEALLEKRDDITFLAVGAATDSPGSVGMVSAGLRRYFRFLGVRQDVDSIVNILDIGVLSSLTEGISNAIVEYMAQAKPVVASDSGATPELVVDGNTGFLFETRNSVSLKDKIEILLADKELRLEMGNRGRNRIKEYFSIEQMRKEYLNVYREVTHY